MHTKLTLILSLVITLICPASYAKSPYSSAPPTYDATALLLRKEPNVHSEVISHMNPGQKIMYIFTKGEWVKVANPQNGDTGWVLQSNLEGHRYPRVYFQTVHGLDKDKQPVEYRVVQIIQNPFDPHHKAKYRKPLQTEKDIQKFLSETQHDFVRFNRDMEKLWKQTRQEFRQLLLPITQPIILVPKD